MSTKSMFRVLLPSALFVLFLAANAVSQTILEAKVPVIVNVPAKVVFAPIFGVDGEGTVGNVTANSQKVFTITFPAGYATSGDDGGVTYLPPGQPNAGVQVKYSRGNVTLNLPAQAYSNAVISLHSVSGKQVLRGNANDGKFSISGSNIPAGVYLLSVKGTKGNFYATKLNHGSDKLNISATFNGEVNSPLKKAGDYGRWDITVSADGYFTQYRTIKPDSGMNPLETFTLIQPTADGKKNFTERVGNLSFDMIYIPGGTFTIGCEKSSGCPANTNPVSGVRVSNYYIAKTTVTTGLWNAVMDITCTPDYRNGVYCPSTSSAYTSMTWYDAMEFACKLSEKTGRHYRMLTEAEWEYAAKNHINELSSLSSTEEWAYNTWNTAHSGGTDPLGPGSGTYDQKTRRNAQNTGDSITGRLIRSIEGIGPALRLAISSDSDYPPGYVSPCNLHMPELGPEPENSYRDPRWVTGSDAQWEATGQMAEAGLAFNLRVWDDGTARLSTGFGSYLTSTNGQWFTSNNIAFVFVPNSGSIKKFAYIFLDGVQGSLIANDYTGRIARRPAANYAKPTISGGLKSGAELAAAAGNEYKMWDMTNIPAAAKEQDERLLDGSDYGWSQNNVGSAHHYRKDVDLDEFRFTVNQGGNRIMLANGNWFTVNNTFLRVTHSTGYTCDYLYLITSDGKFYHNSFMGYERGDFRSFTKTADGPNFNTNCGSICNDEIPKGEAASMYSRMANGASTFVPAPCPKGGCK